LASNENFQKNITISFCYRKSDKPKKVFAADLRIDRGVLLGTQVGKIEFELWNNSLFNTILL